MRDQKDSHLVQAVIEQEAGDFLRAAGCWGEPPVSVEIFQYCLDLDDSYNCLIMTKCWGNDYRVTFKYDDGIAHKDRYHDRQECITRLSLEAIQRICTQIVRDFDNIHESRLMTLPLYRETCEELRQCPEKVAGWLNEKGIRYHAAKNFLQGEKDDHRTDDFSTRFYCDHA